MFSFAFPLFPVRMKLCAVIGNLHLASWNLPLHVLSLFFSESSFAYWFGGVLLFPGRFQSTCTSCGILQVGLHVGRDWVVTALHGAVWTGGLKECWFTRISLGPSGCNVLSLRGARFICYTGLQKPGLVLKRNQSFLFWAQHCTGFYCERQNPGRDFAHGASKTPASCLSPGGLLYLWKVTDLGGGWW